MFLKMIQIFYEKEFFMFTTNTVHEPGSISCTPPGLYVFGTILFRTVSWVRKTNANRFSEGSTRVIGKKLKKKF